MRKSVFHLAEVLESICEALSAVSDNVVVGDRKTVTQGQMDDFITVNVTSTIPDSHVLKTVSLQISLYARCVQNGMMDVERLQEMLDEVTGMMPISDPYGRYSVTDPRVVMKGNDGLGFACWNVVARLGVNHTDSYEY